MLSIRTSKVFSRALGEYLRQADYYSEGMKVEGRCFGRLCPSVGLTEGTEISDEAFARVASNRHALTGAKLTARMKPGRRAGYDAVFNAPKSVSIQAFVGGDSRLIRAHERAVTETLHELETLACHQDGQGMNKRHVPSQGLAAAVFRHGESRALDPHLHSHAFIFNVTATQSGRLLALETGPIFERATYLTEVYRNILAREVQRLGYGIERRENGFEVTGVPPELLARFSKRAQARDTAIAAREAELGRELTRDEIAILVRENRPKKHHDLTPAEVRERQLAQTTPAELAQLSALREKAHTNRLARLPLATVMAHAMENVFERRTVVLTHELAAEILRQSYGQHSIRDVTEAVQHGKWGLLIADGHATTLAGLELEKALVQRVNTGVGACDALGRPVPAGSLTSEQQAAVTQILDSTDRMIAFCGKAGTGKTHTLATAIAGMAAAGREVACFAPTTQAVNILQRDGAELKAQSSAASAPLESAATVQRLLVDPRLQASIANKVVVVDEYGLLSTRQLHDLVELVEQRNGRLLLVGDSAQHASVEAGSGARLLEEESRMTVARIREIRRQLPNSAYRAAAQALADGKIAEGLGKLDAMGAIVEKSEAHERRTAMVAEWFEATQGTVQTVRKEVRPKTALMVAPTWAEIDALNAHAREKLRAAGRLAGPELAFGSLRSRNWTRARLKDPRQYQPGDILVTHRATKLFARGDELRVVGKKKHRLIVQRTQGGQVSVSPRQSGCAWTVCEELPLTLAQGDQVRLRAMSAAQSSDGSFRRWANGSIFTVQSVDTHGRIVLADGATLLSRQVVHGYALTSHAAQGLTIDAVFMAGASTKEGLYVSATRGRERIRIFTEDRAHFLATAGLRTEAQISAIAFARRMYPQLPAKAALRSFLQRAQQHLAHVRECLQRVPAPEPLVTVPLPRATPLPRPKVSHEEEDSGRNRLREEPAERVRMKL